MHAFVSYVYIYFVFKINLQMVRFNHLFLQEVLINAPDDWMASFKKSGSNSFFRCGPGWGKIARSFL